MDLKQHMDEDDPQLCSGVKKIIVRYNTMMRSHSNALMASAFHCFGSQHNPGTVTCVHVTVPGLWDIRTQSKISSITK